MDTLVLETLHFTQVSTCTSFNGKYFPCLVHASSFNCLSVNKKNPMELMLVDFTLNNITYIKNIKDSDLINFQISKGRQGPADLKVSKDGSFCYLAENGFIYGGHAQFQIQVFWSLDLRFNSLKMFPYQQTYVLSVNNRGIFYIFPNCGTFIMIKSLFPSPNLVRKEDSIFYLQNGIVQHQKLSLKVLEENNKEKEKKRTRDFQEDDFETLSIIPNDNLQVFSIQLTSHNCILKNTKSGDFLYLMNDENFSKKKKFN